MPVIVEIENVPDELHRLLQSRAVKAGMSLSYYLLDELRRLAERPTLAEIQARLAQLPVTHLSISPEQIIREERDRP